MVKIDVYGGRDVWLMVFTPAYDASSIRMSKPTLTTDSVFVRASLSAGEEGLRYSLSAYDSGLRRAGLELVRQVYADWSSGFGYEKITSSKSLRRHGRLRTPNPYGSLSIGSQNRC